MESQQMVCKNSWLVWAEILLGQCECQKNKNFSSNEEEQPMTMTGRAGVLFLARECTLKRNVVMEDKIRNLDLEPRADWISLLDVSGSRVRPGPISSCN